jgi:glutathione synthase/RimK-type ligase-like ATP-grasp enzyme
MTEELDDLIQSSLARIVTDKFVLSIYFGRNLAKQYDRLSSKLFRMFYAPLLRAQFVRQKKWVLQSISPIAARDIPESHWPFLLSMAGTFFTGQKKQTTRQVKNLYDIAILHNPDDSASPSNPRALKKFIKAGTALRLNVELIRKEDYGRLAEFDGLFIRETTNVNHHTYRFARRAAAEGIAVIDDPDSILKCTNKVFLAELLERHKIAKPKTMILHKENLAQVAAELGFPCILKQPDSSFSQGVEKADSLEEFVLLANKLLNDSELVIAQQFLPTDFDWRIGVLDRQPLFACKYFMARKHWQIIQHKVGGRVEEGNVETLAIGDVPEKVLRTGLKAANLIGNGLYGVDLKQIGDKIYVIEINDNPSIDAGLEDEVAGDDLYLQVMGSLMNRINILKGARHLEDEQTGTPPPL